MHKALGKGINCLSAEELAQGCHYGWSPRGTKVGLNVNLEAAVLSETEFQEETHPTCHLALPSGYSHRKGKRSKRYHKEVGVRARECMQAALGLVPRTKRSAAQWVKWAGGQRDGEAHANFCEVLSEEYGRF